MEALEMLAGCDDATRREILEQHPELLPTIGLRRLDQVEDEDIRWLWYPYIQAGNLSIIRGDGGSGKSFFSAALMAAISRGHQSESMPGELLTFGNCVYAGREDDASTVKRRVKAAGGDLGRVLVFEGDMELSDAGTVQKIISDAAACLLIVDPVQSFLGAKVDMNKANQVRPILDGLRKVARESGAAILIIEHMNKATQQGAMYRGIGSQDFTSAARSVFLLGPSKTEEDVRYLCLVKTNAIRPKTVAFKIDGGGGFSWLGTRDINADEVAVSAGLYSDPLQYDAIYNGILNLMKEFPDGYHGTANEIVAEISKGSKQTLINDVSFGKRLPGITTLLEQKGIRYTKSRVPRGMAYQFYRVG